MPRKGPDPINADVVEAADTSEALTSPTSLSKREHYQAQLAELERQRDSIEAAERERADTPLALQLTLVSCSFAHISYPADRSIPEYHFDTIPCPFGKTRPDQDCRECSHVQILPYGRHLPAHQRRYVRDGMVMPIKDEEQAEHLAHMVRALNIRPLRRVDLEIHALKQAIEQEDRKTQA